MKGPAAGGGRRAPGKEERRPEVAARKPFLGSFWQSFWQPLEKR
jgi:hypothetical protein